MHCELVGWAKVERRCRRLAGLIRQSGFRPDLIVAIGRGGYVPARVLCDCLHISALTSIRVEHYLAGANRQKSARIRYPLTVDIREHNVLLVDDVNDTGDTLVVAERHLQSLQPYSVRTAVMHQKVVSSIRADYAAREIRSWRWLIYPWAVCEDITGFLRGMVPVPRTLQEARERLAAEFGIQLAEDRLQAIIATLDDTGEVFPVSP